MAALVELGAQKIHHILFLRRCHLNNGRLAQW